MQPAPIRILTLFALLALVVGAGFSFSWWRQASHKALPVAAVEPRYIGDQSCKDCHADVYDKYQRSAMHRTWQPLTNENAVEDFSQNSPVYDSTRDLHYEMVARDGQFFQKEYRKDDQGQIVHELERAISYIIGSGEHARGYVHESNGYLNEMPIWWFREKSSWDVSPSTQAYNFRFERPLTPGCVACHTDSKQLVKGNFNLYETVGSNGIGCERCHGPAEWHVRQQRDGWEPPEGNRDFFVNPSRLPADRRNDVCFQCHLMGDAQFPFPDQDALSYRPGLRLADYRSDYLVDSADPDSFGIVSHAARMVQSRCFTESNGRFHCVTCHDPHISSREVPMEWHRQKCFDCHATDACNRVPDSSVADLENDCIDCHMPRGEPSFVQHTVYTDHWIRRSRSAKEKTATDAAGLATMVDFWNDARMKEERDGIAHIAYAIFSGNQANLNRGMEMLLRGASRGALHGEGWRRLGMGAMLKGDLRLAVQAFDRGVKAYPDDAMLQMGLGSALRSVGDRNRALVALEQAMVLAPGMLEPRVDAAAIYIELQQLQKAKELLEDSLARYPYQASALTMLGMLHYQFLGEVQRGVEILIRASQLDPDNLPLRLTIGTALMAQNELDAARHHMNQALRIAPNEVQTMLVMARLHVLRDEREDAIARLRQVLQKEPNNSSARRFLNELAESP